MLYFAIIPPYCSCCNGNCCFKLLTDTQWSRKLMQQDLSLISIDNKTKPHTYMTVVSIVVLKIKRPLRQISDMIIYDTEVFA